MLFRQLQYSFPVRLLLLHFRSHLVLVFLWIFLGMLVTGFAGRALGIHYLMLTPEYRGDVGFGSFFLTGAAFGGFCMIWHLTTYLLCADRFPFLATLSAPFTKFSFNNSLIPLGFLGVYLISAIWFQSHDELTKARDIVMNMAGFLLGAVVFILLLALYLYFTNKDIAAFLRPGKLVPRPGGRLLIPGQRIPTIGEIRAGATRWRVDTYLTERGHIRLVRSVAHYDPYLLNRVFRQNHANAIAVQAVALLILMAHGWFMEIPWAKVPTSVSIFVLGSMVMAFFGAITFWFRQWSTFVFILLVALSDLITAKGYFNYKNNAYGLEYHGAEVPQYDYPLLRQLSRDSIVHQDIRQTISVLEHWKARQDTIKPKLVLVSVSGGGHKAGLWAVRVLQALDSLTQGNIMRRTALITGASGGMLGAAYMREAWWSEQTDQVLRVQDRRLMADMGADVLNSITSAMVSNDMVFPFRTYAYAGQQYRIDRGYYFEKQLNENFRGRMGRKLSEYVQAESNAQIPMMVLSPYIVNDSRRLLISPLSVSYLTRPFAGRADTSDYEMDGVEFRRLLASQHADSLSFLSALRMNCTFPFILPNTWLPTSPSLETMDAGMRDNFGLSLAVRFTHTFKDWIKANTSGVVLIQIRCWDKLEPIGRESEKGVVGNLLTPAVAASRLAVLQDFDQDSQLALLEDVLGPDQLEVVRFMYRPVRKQREASLSFHLSRREQLDIIEAFDLPENISAARQLLRCF